MDKRKIIYIPETVFKGKRSIDWKAVEQYLKKYIGTSVENIDTGDLIYIGADFPDEYHSSEYTKKLKGANAKAKANAAQVILELVQTASDRRWVKDYKRKHGRKAEYGWYRYDVLFGVPVLDETEKLVYNTYRGTLVIRIDEQKKLYLYDLVNIKKETSKPHSM